jgi:hypothetical protein
LPIELNYHAIAKIMPAQVRKVVALKGTVMMLARQQKQADQRILTRATPPATIRPRAETPLAEAAPVAYGMGLPVGAAGVAPPVEATVGEATPEGVAEQA